MVINMKQHPLLEPFHSSGRLALTGMMARRPPANQCTAALSDTSTPHYNGGGVAEPISAGTRADCVGDYPDAADVTTITASGGCSVVPFGPPTSGGWVRARPPAAQ
jgi:hypothetical protein